MRLDAENTEALVQNLISKGLLGADIIGRIAPITSLSLSELETLVNSKSNPADKAAPKTAKTGLDLLKDRFKGV